MGRRKLIYTHEFPYHVMARSNNKEWFYIPIDQFWSVLTFQLNRMVMKYDILIHSLVLMNNHYHMLVSTHPDHNLGSVMCDLQTSVSRKVNKIAGRINHVFGGNYKACLITNPEYYFEVYKYVYRNPIDAGITLSVKSYRYSTFKNENSLPLSSPINGIAHMIPSCSLDKWLDEDMGPKTRESIRKGLHKTEFKPVIKRKY